MSRLNGVFDREGAVRRPSYRRFLAEWASLLFRFPAAPDPAQSPDGAGHVVLVVPAFLANDLFTRRLRQYLTRCGYRAYGWNAGINWGPTPRLQARLRRRLAELATLEGGKIGVVGVSLGGVMARDLAYDRPGDIRHVVTVVGAFRLPTASTIEPLIQLFAHFYRPALDIARLATPLPVLATAIYTRKDGIVAWESCRADDPRCADIECGGTHVTVCRNPKVLRAVAERLA
jgi:pimeloyl-ACP methyl ester carboxylesterase